MEQTWTVVGFWDDGTVARDQGKTEEEVRHIVSYCIGYGVVGFQIYRDGEEED